MIAVGDRRLEKVLDLSDPRDSAYYLKCRDKLKLNDKQILFMLLYSMPDAEETFRMKTATYTKVFGVTDMVSSKVNAMMRTQKMKAGLRWTESLLTPTFYDATQLKHEHWTLYQKMKDEGKNKEAIQLLKMMGDTLQIYKGGIDDVTTDIRDAVKLATQKTMESYQKRNTSLIEGEFKKAVSE